MIFDAQYEDINSIKELGQKYNNNFSSLFNIDLYINNDNYIVKIIKENNYIIGFIICDNLIDTVDIELIYIDETYRKRGYGKKLVDSLLQYNKPINLEVNQTNIPAMKLYVKCGFVEIARREKYYNGVDAIIMRKEQ